MSVFLSQMVRIIINSQKQRQIFCCYSDTTKTGVERDIEEIKKEVDEGCNKEEVNRSNNGENKNENEKKPPSSGFKRTKTKHYK